VADVESLVEGLQDAVQVAVSLSLLVVPIDGRGLVTGSGTEGDWRQVVEIEESDTGAGKECGAPSGRVADRWSKRHASSGLPM
jgi:hypothetical protein